MAQPSGLPERGLTDWLGDRWVAGAGFSAFSVGILAPFVDALISIPLLLIFLHGPGYMVHQVEEHTRDRFRTFVNTRVFGGRLALTVADVLVINLPLVWGVNLAALYGAFLWGPGWGLVAPYAMLVNAIAHIGGAIRFRCYNPGLATALVVFLPLSIVTIWVVGSLPAVTIEQHIVGLLLAIALHAAVIAMVIRNLRKAPKAA